MKQNRFPFLALSLATSLVAFSSAARADLPDAARSLLATAVASDNEATIETIARTIIETFPDDADDLRSYLANVGSDAANGALDALTATESAPGTPAVPKPAAPPVAAAAALPADLSQAPVPTGFFGFDGWTGTVELAGTLNTGNTDEKAASTAFSLKREGDKWTHELTGTFDFTRTDGATSKRQFKLGYQLNYAVSERSYIFGNTNYENDRFSGFDYRIIAAAGYGYKVINRDDLSWKLEAGPGYRYSDLRDSDDTDSELVGRADSTFNWKLSDTAAFSNSVDVIYGKTTTTFNTLTAITMAINSHLSGKLSLESNTETDPPAGTKKTDTTTRASLVYGF